MSSRYRRYIGQFLAMLAVLLLQLGLTGLDGQLQHRVPDGQFGTRTFVIALSVASLGILSGVILALALGGGAQGSHQRRLPLLGALILGIVPLLAIAYRLLFAATGTDLFSLTYRYRICWLWMWFWLLDSQVPPLWLGLVIGWFAGRRIDD